MANGKNKKAEYIKLKKEAGELFTDFCNENQDVDYNTIWKLYNLHYSNGRPMSELLNECEKYNIQDNITLYRYFEKLEKFLEDPLYNVENYNVTMKQFDDLCQVVFAPVRFTRGITTGLSINAYKIRQMSQGIYQNMGSRIVPRDIIMNVMPSYKNREGQDKIVKKLKIMH